MSIKVNSALVMNTKDQTINRPIESPAEETKQDSYSQNDDSSLFGENDECSFVKGYN